MSCCGAIAVAPDAVSASVDRERVLAASHSDKSGLTQTDLLVPEMHCISCIRKIESGLAAIPEVCSVRANLSTRRVSVQWRSVDGGSPDFLAELERLGFQASLFDLADAQDGHDDVGSRLLRALAVAGFASANIMLLSVSIWSGADPETTQLFHLISGLIAVPAVLFAGRPFFASAIQVLSVRRLNMDVPISLAVLLALAMSVYESMTGGHHAYFDASVTLLFFLLIGRYLDHMMRERARGAIMQLSNMMPRGATRVNSDGTMSYIPLKEIAVGDVIRVAAGERVPLDSTIVSGRSDIERSLVTGEAQPVSAHDGMELEAGVLNLTGPVRLRVSRTEDKSFISEILQMMEAAEQSKSAYVRVADRMATIYAPAVHALAAIAFLAWLTATGGDWQTALYVAIAVLIITCPCALGLAVPIAQVVAANRLFRSGVLVKDGAGLEKLRDIDTVVFDKTGTVTLGIPQVTQVDGGAEQVPEIAAELAGQSSHPFAQAVARELRNSEDKASGGVPVLTEIEEVPGFGIQARADGRTVRLGRRSWVSEIAASGGAGKPAAGSEVCFAWERGSITRFQLRDRIRPDASRAISALTRCGLETEMLSGDLEGAVRSVAQEVGIPVFQAALTPADKVRRIRELQAVGHKVLYVGDGLNDAPALAAADVSIAPSSGSDIGRLSSDLVFTGKDLGAIHTAHVVAKHTATIVRQNFALAIAYNCIAVPVAMMGWVTPLIAALAMSGSSIAVVANSLRLNLTSVRLPEPRSHEQAGPPPRALQSEALA